MPCRIKNYILFLSPQWGKRGKCVCHSVLSGHTDRHLCIHPGRMHSFAFDPASVILHPCIRLSHGVSRRHPWICCFFVGFVCVFMFVWLMITIIGGDFTRSWLSLPLSHGIKVKGGKKSSVPFARLGQWTIYRNYLNLMAQQWITMVSRVFFPSSQVAPKALLDISQGQGQTHGGAGMG